MSELIKIESGDFLALMHSTSKGMDIPHPFEKDIFLFDSHIAGTTHVPDIDTVCEKLDENSRLSFFREPDNEFDEMAIVIKTADGEKVGYVPKNDNVIFSRLMDAGKLLFGKISEKEKKGKWHKISIKIYLHE